MSYNGSGTFLINTAGQPVVSGTVISSTAFNALTADLATGLSTAITKDGQTTVTANIPMSTYKFTGLGVGSAATDSANLSQVQSTVTKLLNSVSGADTITATASPTLAAYAAGQMFYFVAAGDNTTSVTLNIDSLGAKAVTRDGATALAASDIKSGEVVVVVYDGTRFQVVSQLNSAGDARFANVSIASALNVGGVVTLSGGTANGVAYLNGSKALTSGSALAFDGTNFSIGAPWTTNPFAGTTAPVYFQYSASSNVIRLAGDAGVAFTAFRFSDNSGAPSVQLGKARGTYASPSAVQTGDNLGDIQFRGYGGTTNRTLANVTAFVETYTSDSNISSYLEFRTSSSGSASGTEKMRLTAAGDLGIGTTSPLYKLVVSNAGAQGFEFDPANGILQVYNRSTSAYGELRPYGSLMRFYTGSSPVETMRLTAAGDLGIGTASPSVKLEVTGNARILNSGADSQVQVFSPNGFASFVRYGEIGAADRAVLGFAAGSGTLQYRYGATSMSTGTLAFSIDGNGNVVAGGNAALATTATNGFLYVPTCAGTPTGTPTAITGMAPIVVNTTNNKLYFYSGGAWRDAGP